MKNKRTISYWLAIAFLSVSLSAKAEAPKVIVKDYAGNAKFIVTDSGRIASGRNAPLAGLHLKGSTIATTQVISQLSSPTHSNGGGGGYVGYYTIDDGTLPKTGERLGYLLFGSLDGVQPLNAAGVSAYAEGDWSKNPGGSYTFPVYLTFETACSGARTEKMRVTSTGNIGIGVTSPTQRLEVAGGVRINSTSTRPACDISATGTLWFIGTKMTVCAKKPDNTYKWFAIDMTEEQ